MTEPLPNKRPEIGQWISGARARAGCRKNQERDTESSQESVGGKRGERDRKRMEMETKRGRERGEREKEEGEKERRKRECVRNDGDGRCTKKGEGEGGRKKEEGRRKKEEGGRRKEEGRRRKEGERRWRRHSAIQELMFVKTLVNTSPARTRHLQEKRSTD